jgi:hypothetical protein
MYQSHCISARNALRCRESALQLLCETIIQLDEHAKKLRELKISHADPSKRSFFQRMGGGGDLLEQVAKFEAKVAAESDLLVRRRQIYNEVRTKSDLIFVFYCSRCVCSVLFRCAVRFKGMRADYTRCSCRISRP